MKKQIGSTVREIRIKKNFTLEQLSKKTGLSISFLSQFERGITSIALDSLFKIANALETDVVNFFEDEENQSIIMKNYQEKPIHFSNKSTISKLLSNNLSEMIVCPRLITLMPQQLHEEVVSFSHLGEDFIYVLEGVLTLHYNNKKFELYPEETAHYKSSVPHNWSNDTNRLVRFISITTPNPLYKLESDD